MMHTTSRTINVLITLRNLGGSHRTIEDLRAFKDANPALLGLF